MHECVHETDIALTNQTLGTMQEDIKLIKEAILGNGHPGLKTDVAVLKRQMGWVWALVSIETVVIVTAAFKTFGG